MPRAQAGPIAVYGATGFTGRLVAGELARREADLVLAGRSAAKLEALSARLGGAAFRAVSLDDAGGLRDLLGGCAAVIACAGPFARYGEPVVAAAAATGTHYLDTTGEQPFMRLVQDRHGPVAERSGAVLVTAMGFDYVPGDMIASLTAAGIEPLEEVVLAYAVHGLRATRGTTLSGLDMISGGDLEYDGGRLRPASRKVSRGTFSFPAPIGEQRMVRYPAGEHLTVPRHVRTRKVTTLLTGATVAPPALVPLLPLSMPLLAGAMRTPIRGVAARLVERLPEGPDEARRAANRFTIVCEARSAAGARRGVVSGVDVYGLTAATIVEGALLAAAPTFDRSGALAPAQAFEPAPFLDSLAGAGVEYEVTPLPAATAAPAVA